MIKAVSRVLLPYNRGFFFLFSARNTIAARHARVTGCFNIRAMSASVNSSSATVNKFLNGINDNYGGVVVQMNEPMDPQLFASLLKSSISHWRQQAKKGVWIKLPIELANLVEPAVKEGFWFHHAEPNYLMLVYWIPGGANTLPANASHRVGVGAFVMNGKREVLVVQENSGRFRGTGIWKFPTGVVDEGEDICVAAVREVKEETSIDTEFVEVLAFRQSHQSFFEKSDIFFLCMLRPLSFDIQKQESEIEAAEWMPLEEYAAQPYVQNQELLKYIVDICSAKVDTRGSPSPPLPVPVKYATEQEQPKTCK
ncbi:Nudix hydrolase domain-containing protein [Citrus sinensis]|nr:Nudix hydrolase domain-containing protein [Citrus sinensis]